MRQLAILGLCLSCLPALVFSAEKPRGELIASVSCADDGVASGAFAGMEFHIFRVEDRDDRVQIFIGDELEVRDVPVTVVRALATASEEGQRLVPRFVVEQHVVRRKCGIPPTLVNAEKAAATSNELFLMSLVEKNCDQKGTAIAISHDFGAKTATLFSADDESGTCEWVPAKK